MTEEKLHPKAPLVIILEKLVDYVVSVESGVYKAPKLPDNREISMMVRTLNLLFKRRATHKLWHDFHEQHGSEIVRRTISLWHDQDKRRAAIAFFDFSTNKFFVVRAKAGKGRFSYKIQHVAKPEGHSTVRGQLTEIMNEVIYG